MIRRIAFAALTLAWSACSVSAGLPHASFTTSRGATASRASSASPSEAVHTPAPTGRRFIHREQLIPLAGLTIAEVRQHLKELGHVGRVNIVAHLPTTLTCYQDIACEVVQEVGYTVDSDIRIETIGPPDRP